MKRVLVLQVLLLAWAGLAYAQERQITGRVTDARTAEPIPGVNVVVEGSALGTATNTEGAYRLSVPGPNAVLMFTFVGYQAHRETVGDRTTVDVALAEDVTMLQDVVVVGYGTQRREAVTGSVSTVDASEAFQGMVTAPTQMLQGRVAGVNIIRNSGEPGSNFVVRVRGGTSISASNDPLYVIDGVPIDNSNALPGGNGAGAGRNPLNLLNPADIETMTVLKDASATAIYGSRGANGVVLIQTKNGRAGTVTVDYEGSASSSIMAKKLDLLNASEYRSFIESALASGQITLKDDNKNGVHDQIDRLGSADTDWQDVTTRNAVSQFHNLAISGGAQNTMYRASVSYTDEEGIVRSSGLQRLTARLNANHNTWNNRLRLGLNVSTAYVEDDFLQNEETSGFQGGVLTNAVMYNPSYPVRSDDGRFFEADPTGNTVRNPVALTAQIDDFGKTTRSMGNISADLDLIKGLTAQLRFGVDRSQGSRRQYFPRENPLGTGVGGQALLRNGERTSSTLQTYLTYNNSFASVHNIEILGGYEFNEFLTEEFGAESRNFVTDYWRYNNIGGGLTDVKPYSNKFSSRLVSFFGRTNYSFGNKYILQGSLRYDGSSRFGSGNKWALFPSISAAWRLSEEPFLRGLTALSDLRIKAGWGVVGSQEIGNYRSLQLLAPSGGFRAVLGNGPVTGVAPTTYANPGLKWEETHSYNIGIDYGLFNGKYSGTLEYYEKRTDNLLLEIDVPQPAVVGTRLENIGAMLNKGLEFSFDALMLARPDRNLSVGLVFSTEKNEVTDMGARSRIITGTVSGRGQTGVNSQIITEGEPIGSFYGLEFIGVETTADLNGDGKVDKGKQVFKDQNGDGIINPSDDRVIIGVARPDFSLGLRTDGRFGNFDFNVFVRGDFGQDVFNNTALVYQTKSAITQNQNFLRAALDDPDGVTEPAVYSSRWIQDGSFLRLDNVTIGYRLNLQNLASQIRNARIFLSAQNLFVLTGYDGYDPEVNTSAGLASRGIDYNKYPRPRTFTLGVNVGF